MLDDIQTLSAPFLARTREALRADRLSLFVHDTDAHELHRQSEQEDSAREIRIPDDEGIVGLAFQQGDLLNIPDVRRDPRHRSDIAALTDYVCVAMMVCTVTAASGHRLGVLQAINKLGGGGFSAADEAQLRDLAGHIGKLAEDGDVWEARVASALPGLLPMLLAFLGALLALGFLPSPYSVPAAAMLAGLACLMLARKVLGKQSRR